MKNAALKDMEDLCDKLNIHIRYEKTQAKGGLCKVNGKNLIIVDKKASDLYKQSIIGKALKSFDLSNVHLKPRLREMLEDKTLA